MDTIEAFSWKFVSLHSSRPISTALVRRLWGKSTVLRWNISAGTTSLCLLKRCWNSQNDVAGRYIVQFVDRHRHTSVHNDLDRHLLHIAKHDYGRSDEVYRSLYASELWRLWIVSARYCTSGVHEVNKTKVRRALRGKGITLTPDSDIRIPIPATVLATKRDLTIELQKQLLQSFVPGIICTHILRSVHIVKSASPTIGGMLRNHGKMIALLQKGDLP
jgi:hypothetical protein